MRGEKGTAKSTAVRAFAALLPPLTVVAGCPCKCDPESEAAICPFCREQLLRGEKLVAATRPVPVVDLPVSATEDRLVGSLDFEHALRYGRRRFEPGILARANRGIIYVDEVNLLDDHLVDLLLDAAASGVNVVEREGISFCPPGPLYFGGDDKSGGRGTAAAVTPPLWAVRTGGAGAGPGGAGGDRATARGI